MKEEVTRSNMFLLSINLHSGGASPMGSGVESAGPSCSFPASLWQKSSVGSSSKHKRGSSTGAGEGTRGSSTGAAGEGASDDLAGEFESPFALASAAALPFQDQQHRAGLSIALPDFQKRSIPTLSMLSTVKEDDASGSSQKLPRPLGSKRLSSGGGTLQPIRVASAQAPLPRSRLSSASGISAAAAAAAVGAVEIANTQTGSPSGLKATEETLAGCSNDANVSWRKAAVQRLTVVVSPPVVKGSPTGDVEIGLAAVRQWPRYGEGPYITRIKAVRTGGFRFKGSNDVINMVQLVTTALEERVNRYSGKCGFNSNIQS